MLSDFGIARDLQDTGLTATGMVIGTIDYCSPEQLGTAADIGGRADQYSLACTAFFLLTGSKPFPGATPTAVLAAHLYGEPVRLTQVRPDLSPAVENVLLRALSKTRTPGSPPAAPSPTRCAGRCTRHLDPVHRLRLPGSRATRPAIPTDAADPPPPPHVPAQSVVPNLYKPHPTRSADRASSHTCTVRRTFPGYVGPVPGYPPAASCPAPPHRADGRGCGRGRRRRAGRRQWWYWGRRRARRPPDPLRQQPGRSTADDLGRSAHRSPPHRPRQQHNIARGTAALDPCRIPAGIVARAGQVTTPLEARDGAGQMILCVGNAVGIVGPEISSAVTCGVGVRVHDAGQHAGGTRHSPTFPAGGATTSPRPIGGCGAKWATGRRSNRCSRWRSPRYSTPDPRRSETIRSPAPPGRRYVTGSRAGPGHRPGHAQRTVI